VSARRSGLTGPQPVTTPMSPGLIFTRSADCMPITEGSTNAGSAQSVRASRRGRLEQLGRLPIL
jgi:hypothetical protein